MSNQEHQGSVLGHTRGPWRVFMSTDGRVMLGVGDKDGGGILDSGFGTWRSGPEQLANARLAASAPNLLEALKNAASVMQAILSPPRVGTVQAIELVHAHYDAARQAIARAEGRDNG